MRLKWVLLAVCILAVGFVVIAPFYARERPQPRTRGVIDCANLHALCVADQMYVLDHGRFPNAGSWMDELGEYISNEKTFLSPYDDKQHTYGYAMNSQLSGVKPADPRNLPHVIVFFTTESAKRNASGSPAILCCGHESDERRCVLAYADGDVNMLARGQRPE